MMILPSQFFCCMYSPIATSANKFKYQNFESKNKMKFTFYEKLGLGISCLVILFCVISGSPKYPYYPQHPSESSNQNSFSAQKFLFEVKPELLSVPSLKASTLPFMIKLKMEDLIREKFKRVPVDLVIAFDRSGSMAGSKMKLLKESLIRFLDF